ncbi:tripartite tricarboxylate transporter permease [Candidatus Pacearchaeota archaeon]|nr:tripartite tricarboxylate transporter permease [Candidatus Pacearchaeota archaeon]
MLIEIILFFFLGLFFGTLAGLIPGIHINLIGAALVSLSISALVEVNTIYLVVFIVSMSISQTFIDFIPGIFLGCPDTDTALSTLPGHKLLKEGKGYEAVMLCSYGCLYGGLILVILIIPLILLIPKIYSAMIFLIPYLLILVSLWLVFSEKKKIQAASAFLISGILGLLVFNVFDNPENSLLPLLTGLFGSSMLLISIKNKIVIPPQKITEPRIRKMRPLISSAIVSPLSIVLPAIGSSQIAIIGSSIAKTDDKGFLFLLGSINLLAMSFSFLALYLISKTRTGSAAAINDILKLTPEIFALIIITIIFSVLLSFFISKFLVKNISQIITSFSYTKISVSVLIFLIIMISIFSGALGLVIFVIATFTGVYIILMDVRKTNMMGCLILPTIILYLF